MHPLSFYVAPLTTALQGTQHSGAEVDDEQAQLAARIIATAAGSSPCPAKNDPHAALQVKCSAVVGLAALWVALKWSSCTNNVTLDELVPPFMASVQSKEEDERQLHQQQQQQRDGQQNEEQEYAGACRVVEQVLCAEADLLSGCGFDLSALVV